MSVYDTTAAVVKVWGHLQTLPQPADTLEGIWAAMDSTFYPDACRALIKAILKAFPGAANVKKNVRYTLIKDSTVNPNGTIDTVAALAEAILQSLETSEVVFLPPTVAQAASRS